MAAGGGRTRGGPPAAIGGGPGGMIRGKGSGTPAGNVVKSSVPEGPGAVTVIVAGGTNPELSRKGAGISPSGGTSNPKQTKPPCHSRYPLLVRKGCRFLGN